jgi:hypothetical protein
MFYSLQRMQKVMFLNTLCSRKARAKMCKVNLTLVLFCILLSLGTVYGVRFEVVDSSFQGQVSGYAGDRPLDDPCTPEHEEDTFSTESSSLNIDTITRNSTETVYSERTAYAEAGIGDCGLTAAYNCWTRTESYTDGSTEIKATALISLPTSGSPNAHFRVTLDEESSRMPFIAHLSFAVTLYNYGNGTSAGLTGLNDEILVKLTRNSQTTTISSYSVTNLSDNGSFEDSYNLDITVYENDIISIYGGTQSQLLTTANGSTSSYASLFINLELDPDECPADLAEDYRVDMEDFAVFATYWLTSRGAPFPYDSPVDTPELMWMVDWWLWDNTVGCPVPEFATPLVPNKEYRGTTHGEGSHWYQYTPTVGGLYSFELLCHEFVPVLRVFEPNIAEGFDLRYSMDGDLLICNLVEGSPYYLEIAGMDGDTGPYILKMTSGAVAPINDLCSNRSSIAMDSGDWGAYGAIDGKTYGATGEDETPTCGENDVQDVWYSVTLPMAGNYYITLVGTDGTFTGTLAVFDGLGTCQGTLQNCAELTSPGNYVDLQYAGEANETIVIRVGSSASASGNFSVNLSLSVPNL